MRSAQLPKTDAFRLSFKATFHPKAGSCSGKNWILKALICCQFFLLDLINNSRVELLAPLNNSRLRVDVEACN